MVAYSFKLMFRGQIKAWTKTQTIRAEGKRRHARPGEALQLYTGMRTPMCAKIMPDPCCSDVNRIAFDFTGGRFKMQFKDTFWRPVEDAFARADGVPEGAEQMRAFWKENHGEVPFDGFLIGWRPWVPGDRCPRKGCKGHLDIQAGENCYCQISPPCDPCINAPLICRDCNEEVEVE